MSHLLLAFQQNSKPLEDITESKTAVALLDSDFTEPLVSTTDKKETGIQFVCSPSQSSQETSRR